ncbi:hypothetical protein BDZ97DRAFT_1679841 [Flammula alnicola]|nr:hypothetical protein BDZ97DRAFT_1679841 [Flammula alnicola]
MCFPAACDLIVLFDGHGAQIRQSITLWRSTYFLGLLLLALTTYIRVICYQTLGNFFTFRVMICDNHRLLVTGPYRYVRHPSYSAIYLAMLAVTISDFTLWDSVEKVIGNIAPRFLLCLWILWTLLAVEGLRNRAQVEDRLLRTRFAENWEGYRKRVPYKFIPGIV